MDWLLSQQQHISSLLHTGRLPHALLISGMKGAGKDVLSNWLVQTLSCQSPLLTDNNFYQACGHCKHCLLLQNATYPDHQNIVSEKQTIGVDDIRQASAFLQKKSQLLGMKTLLISNAETMTESAANALLKTLEEPTENTVIILTSSDVPRLLPTIISRCQQIDIRPYSGEQLAKLTNTANVDKFTNVTHLPELTDAKVQDNALEFTTNVTAFLSGNGNRQAVVNELVNNENAMRWLEKHLVDLQRGQSNWLHADSAISSDVAHKAFQLYIAAKQQILNLSQANKAMVCDKLMIELNFLFNESNSQVN